jgi:hypothetical protein
MRMQVGKAEEAKLRAKLKGAYAPFEAGAAGVKVLIDFWHLVLCRQLVDALA